MSCADIIVNIIITSLDVRNGIPPVSPCTLGLVIGLPHNWATSTPLPSDTSLSKQTL